MTRFLLRLPDDLKERAAEQATAVGVSLHQYIATALAAHVEAQAEVEHLFVACAARVTPDTHAKSWQERAGRTRHGPDDLLEKDDQSG